MLTTPIPGLKEETNMSELRYPNESRDYPDARDLLLKDEQELVDKLKSVASRRRNLPPGGRSQTIYDMESDLETTIALTKTHDPLH